ncbi:hypothetical protein EZS27_027608, partial [termite gut metagenome]
MHHKQLFAYLSCEQQPRHILFVCYYVIKILSEYEFISLEMLEKILGE